MHMENEQQNTPSRKVEARWTPKLATRFCPVSSFFLGNYHRLAPHGGARGLNSTEALLIIHLMDYKWDARAPYPTLTTISEKMGLTVRAVRSAVKRLEDLGYLVREPSRNGGPNRYHLEGLFKALEELQEKDVSASDAAEGVS